MNKYECLGDMWKETIEEHDNDVIDKMLDFHFDHVLDPERNELWIQKDDEGNISYLIKDGNYAAERFNEHECLIYACGGDKTVWDILPPVTSMVFKEDLYSFISDDSDDSFTDIIPDVQEYVEREAPNLIEEALEVYKSDEHGHIREYIEDIYYKLLDDLDSLAS
ncbi:hypothetical protein [Ruminococcus sp.]|uniref:hypothetical protein n=1 Tax=Ruminococcus sp. TaxID=41978 RepID=UPI0025E488D2|nr:hypothetical protein [Ruminococcus sp.]